MRAQLARLKPDELRDLIGRERLEEVEGLRGEAPPVRTASDTAALADILLALRGEQLLDDPAVRRRLLTLLPEERLRDLAEAFAGRVFAKPADNGLALASLPWKAGSPFPLAMVSSLGISERFLPRSQRQAAPVEAVFPFKKPAPLRDYQEEVCRHLTEELRRGSPRVLVQMPTGGGKTKTTMEALCRLAVAEEFFDAGRSIFWLAHVEELCEQAAASFIEVWRAHGRGPGTVVRAWGTNRPDLEEYRGAFVVGTYQKFAALARGDAAELTAIATAVRVVVADEAHKVLAPTFRDVLERMTHSDHEGVATIVGLTATPGRGINLNQENVELASFFARNLITPLSLGENPIRELRVRGVLARVNHQVIESGETATLSTKERAIAEDSDLPTAVLDRLASSIDRNRLIVKTIGQEIDRGRACLVFACSVGHSRLLAATLTLEGYRAAHLDATLSKGARREVVSRLRDGGLSVLFNYGVLSTGFDAPRIATIVITRPTTSVVLYSQMVGRGLRGPKSGGNAECNLIDVRDNFRSFGGVDEVYATFAEYWQ